MTQRTIMLCGMCRYSLDNDGRFHVPPRWRQAIEQGEWVMMAWPVGAADHLLVGWPEALLSVLAGELSQAGIEGVSSEAGRVLARHAVTVKLDSAGRLTLPCALRKLSGLESENTLLLLGCGGHFEIRPADWRPPCDLPPTVWECLDDLSQLEL